jgi:hypothetical protein
MPKNVKLVRIRAPRPYTVCDVQRITKYGLKAGADKDELLAVVMFELGFAKDIGHWVEGLAAIGGLWVILKKATAAYGVGAAIRKVIQYIIGLLQIGLRIPDFPQIQFATLIVIGIFVLLDNAIDKLLTTAETVDSMIDLYDKMVKINSFVELNKYSKYTACEFIQDN